MKRKILKVLGFVAILALLVVFLNPVNVTVDNTDYTITVGTTASAAGVADYTCDGVQDNVQIQAAIDALPATGGEIVLLTGNYNFAATITRAIDNVIITGNGDSTYIANNGVTALFSAGSQEGWIFRDFSTDAGGITLTNATNYRLDNITIGTDYYPASVRTATYVVAGSDAPEQVKSQADSICDGTTDNEEIQAAIDKMSDNESLYLSGTFYVRDTSFLYGKNNITVFGDGIITQSHFVESSLTVDMGAADTSVTVASSAGFQAGDGVAIYDDSHTDAYSVLAQIDNITGNVLNLTRISRSAAVLQVVDNAKVSTIFPYISVAQGNLAAHTDNTSDVKVIGITFDGNSSIVLPTHDTIRTYMVDTYQTINAEIDSCVFKNGSIGAAKPVSHFSKLLNCSFRDFVINDYEVVHTGGTFGFNDCVTIDNNNFYNNTCSNAVRGGVVYLCLNLQTAKITNNVFDTYGTYAIETIGATGNGYNHNIIISGNQFYNSTVLNGYGVYLAGINEYFDISDNIFDLSTGTEKTAIYMVGPGSGSYNSTNININSNTFIDGRLQLVSTPHLVNIDSNTFSNSASNAPIIGYGSANVSVSNNLFDVVSYIIYFRNTNTNWTITNNVIEASTPLSTVFSYHATHTENNIRAYGNVSYIAPGEVRSASGTLTAGVTNATAFSWHNPELQDILIKKVVVEVTTAGGTAGSGLQVGIADDSAGTNLGTEFANTFNLNNASVYDSWYATDNGTQVKWVLCQDYVSATDGWIVGKILNANASSLVGRYYIEYVGR